MNQPDQRNKTTYLRLSVTGRCDMRCSYCMPSDHWADARTATPLSVGEIVRLVSALARCGVSKVRITGGEPLVREDILDVVAAVAQTPGISTVGLTTNGLRLLELAEPLLRAGVNLVNVSLDSLNRESFHRITGSDDLPRIIEGLHAAVALGFRRVKTNTVVMRGVNDHEVRSIAVLAQELPIDVRFIELMPLGCTTAEWRSLFVPAHEIRPALGELELLPGDRCDTAKLYAAQKGAGRIGIISPVSDNFCGRCNRVRITSHGVLMPCLRSGAARDIRPLLAARSSIDAIRESLSWCETYKLRGASLRTEAVRAPAMCAIGG